MSYYINDLSVDSLKAIRQYNTDKHAQNNTRPPFGRTSETTKSIIITVMLRLNPPNGMKNEMK